MEQEELYILKRDGSRQLFEAEKIRSAIYKAYRAGGVRPDPSSVDVIVARIESVARAFGLFPAQLEEAISANSRQLFALEKI